MKLKAITGPVARYSLFVIISRYFLWFLIAAVVATIFWLASDDKGDNASRMVFSNVPKSENLQNEMLKPNYQGLDAKNNPFTVIADKAIQKDKDTVLLENIRADMQQKNGSWLALNAGSGELNLPGKQLLLMDGVSMFYDGGYEFTVDHAQVDIGKGNAYGETPVKGQGPIGTLQADGFEAENRGEIIRFNGSVRLKIYRK